MCWFTCRANRKHDSLKLVFVCVQLGSDFLDMNQFKLVHQFQPIYPISGCITLEKAALKLSCMLTHMQSWQKTKISKTFISLHSIVFREAAWIWFSFNTLKFAHRLYKTTQLKPDQDKTKCHLKKVSNLTANECPKTNLLSKKIKKACKLTTTAWYAMTFDKPWLAYLESSWPVVTLL